MEWVVQLTTLTLSTWVEVEFRLWQQKCHIFMFYTISILLILIFHLVHHLKWDLAIHVHQTWQPYRGTPVFSKTFLAYLSKGVCAPVWDDMYCLPPTPAGVMAVFPCNTGPKGKKKSKWGNPVKKCTMLYCSKIIVKLTFASLHWNHLINFSPLHTGLNNLCIYIEWLTMSDLYISNKLIKGSDLQTILI